jgi:hypothetical protein
MLRHSPNVPKNPKIGDKFLQRCAGSILHTEWGYHRGQLGWWIVKTEPA